MVSEEKAQVSIEYLLVIAAIITLIVVISLFIKGSLLQKWFNIGGGAANQTLNRTT